MGAWENPGVAPALPMRMCADTLMRPAIPVVTITLHVGFVVAGMATTLLGPILPETPEHREQHAFVGALGVP